jgi:PAS domain S-box-containing protein
MGRFVPSREHNLNAYCEEAVTSEAVFGSETLEAMLGALPVPAYTNDLRGFVTWQNEAARAVGGDRVGTHYREAVPPEELPRARETFAAVTLGGETRRRTGRYKSPDGDLVKLEVIVSPIRVDGKIAGVFGIAIPVDELPQESATQHLSPRQLDVLRLLAQAKSTAQIAEELHLAPETVRNHVRAVLKTLGARSRLEATLVALRDGVVSLDLD